MSFEDEVYQKQLSTPKKVNKIKTLEAFKKDIKKLSYEECISALEIILTNVQDENITLNQIKINYIKGHLLLEHCEKLLQFLEQDINEINPSLL
tara:strand:+ start:427 stop:708 length:282 start_codon:yes stop_codon:yes gene_type:complete